MKNTLIPLLVAFVGQDGRIIALRDMTPCEVEPCPMYGVHDPFELAIEANRGWFEEHGSRSARASSTVSATPREERRRI
jgi:uncharacterized membrane protein (UPF0127 family)